MLIAPFSKKKRRLLHRSNQKSSAAGGAGEASRDQEQKPYAEEENRPVTTLNHLSPEIVVRIAVFTATDRELCNFQTICPRTYAVIAEPRASIWRTKYIQTYDLCRQVVITNAELKKEYQTRQRVVAGSRHVRIRDGYMPKEQIIVELLKILITESFSLIPRQNAEGVAASKNLLVVAKICGNSHLLEHNLEVAIPKLVAIRLVLTHLVLDTNSIVPSGFEYSQQAVYGHPNDFPLFTDGLLKQEINMEYLLHIANFFQYHITEPDEQSLYSYFAALANDEKPQAWTAPVQAGLSKLGTHWKGSYAYLHNAETVVEHLRSHLPGGNRIYMDDLDTETSPDGFVSLHLDFSRPRTTPWPEVFELHLRGLPPRRPAPAIASQPTDGSSSSSSQISVPPTPGVDYHPFHGSGHDTAPYACAGNLAPLPDQAGGFPGFQYVTMIKWFANPLVGGANNVAAPWPSLVSPFVAAPSGMQPHPLVVEAMLGAARRVADIAELDVEIWAYEGVVLPGGKIMLGRWWSPRETPDEDLVAHDGDEDVEPAMPGEARDYHGERTCTGTLGFPF